MTTTPVAVLANAVSVALGGVVTHVVYRAHRRTASRPLLWLTVGLATLTLVGLLGVVDAVTGVDPATVRLVEAVALALGFGLVAVALYRQVE